MCVCARAWGPVLSPQAVLPQSYPSCAALRLLVADTPPPPPHTHTHTPPHQVAEARLVKSGLGVGSFLVAEHYPDTAYSLFFVDQDGVVRTAV